MKTLGIVAHSAEGGALCFITACREGAAHLGPHMHPDIVLSAVPMGLSMPGWMSGDRAVVARNLTRGVQQVADAGADFFVCPDNTAHIVLEEIVGDLPLPGLHIADVVCGEIGRNGWRNAGLLGTRWTMTGPVYAKALAKRVDHAWKLVRRAAGHRQERGALERIFAVGVGVALVLFEALRQQGFAGELC